MTSTPLPPLTADSRPQFGLDTFGDMTNDLDGHRVESPEVIRQVLKQGQLADELGLDFFGIGEHHREDFAVSSPDMVLAALASTTQRIRLGSAVTVLSSDDPLRVFERFSTLDALSHGRAEAVMGRGSFTESFSLFGYRLEDYETLFNEKLELFSKALSEKPISWEGSHRAPVSGAQLMPRTQNGLSAWVGVGGSPDSVLRSVKYSIPMKLAVIGGDPARFKPFVELYHRTREEMGKERMPLALHSPGFIAESDEEAIKIFQPSWMGFQARLARERGWRSPTPESFLHEIESGSAYVGSPDRVAEKIARSIKVLGLNRFDLKYSTGPLAHEHLMSSIRLYATEVVPRVREILAR